MRARALAALALVAPLTAGLLVAGAAPAAAAVSAPGSGTVFSSETTVELRAEYPGSARSSRLVLTSPTGESAVVGTADGSLRGGAIQGSLDTGCWVPEGGCTGRVPARNGTWTLTLSGSQDSTSTFVLRVPPRAPTDVAASAASDREVVVTWRRGAEPDLTGWTVADGSTVRQSVDPAACDGGTCRAVVRYEADAPGEHAYTVRALRAAGPGSSETVESPASAPAAVTLGATPTASPDGAPATPGSPTPGAASASPTPGGGVDDVRAGSGTATAPGAFGPGFAPPGTSARGDSGPLPLPLTAPPPQPLLDDPAAERVLVAPRLRETGDPASASGRTGETLLDVLGGEQVAISAAGILVLGMAFAHVRRWLGAPPVDLA